MWINILVFNKCLKEIEDSQKEEELYSTVPSQNIINNTGLVTRAQLTTFNRTLKIKESELHKDKEIPMKKDEELNEPISEQKSLHSGLDVEDPTAKENLSQKDL